MNESIAEGMGMITPQLADLRQCLGNLSPGKIIPGQPESHRIMEAVRDAWSFLEGADIEKTYAHKLSRAEEVIWEPPCLTFRLERHGALVLGSGRAEMHCWTINMEELTASMVPCGYRHPYPNDRSMTQKGMTAIAEEIGNQIVKGINSSFIEWLEPDQWVMVHIAEVIPVTNKATTQARRKRFRLVLENHMKGRGWIRKDKGNRLGFVRQG
jgi:hypothetical protein